MIEVLRRAASGSGCVLQATAATLDDAREMARGCEGVVLRDDAGDLYPAEPPMVADCLRGWVGLEVGILEDIASYQHEVETAAHVAMLDWSWDQCQRSNARCRRYRARLRTEAGTERRSRCLVCGDEIVEAIRRTGGRPRVVCEAPDCQRTAAADRRRASRHRCAVRSTPPPVGVEGRTSGTGVDAPVPLLAA